MKDFIKIVVAFLALLSFFILPMSIKPTLSSYQAYKSIEDYSKIKVKVDSSNFDQFDHRDKGYFDIFYANGEKKFRLNNYENHILSTSYEKKKFAHFFKSERDSMYLWVNENAKTIYAIPNEKTLNKNLLLKEFLIDLSIIIVSLFFILTLIIIILKNSRKIKQQQKQEITKKME